MIRLTGIARFAIFLTLALLLASCGRFNRQDPLETLPLEGLYAEGKRSLEIGNPSRAQRYYQRLIARFPYGPYTEQAQVELAYAFFKGNKPEEATSAINRFIRTYPAHPSIDYMYYLRGLVNFNRNDGALLRIAQLDPAQREQVSLQQSFNDFGDLIQRYPSSRYAADARDKMAHLRNRMARHDMNVAVFYLERSAWVAAANRGKYVIEHYPQSIYTSDALAVMSEAYLRMGQETLADDARRVLQLNHPNHPYLRGDWPAERAWWRKLSPFGSDKRNYHGDSASVIAGTSALDSHG